MQCGLCLQVKPATAFYASNKAKCKECVKASVRANRVANIDHYRAFDRRRSSLPHRVEARAKYQETPEYEISHSAAARRWAANNTVQRKAQIKLGNAVRDGKVTPWPGCAVPSCCEAPEAHHPDYSRPLDVVWLCPKHHAAAHSLVKPHNMKKVSNAMATASIKVGRKVSITKSPSRFTEGKVTEILDTPRGQWYVVDVNTDRKKPANPQKYRLGDLAAR